MVKAFHGGPRRETFKNKKMDRDRKSSDINALGPGIYLTSDIKEAKGYSKPFKSGCVHVVEVDTKKKFSSVDKKPNRSVLKYMISKCPDKDLLYNYGYENHAQNINWAINAYMDEDTLLDGLCAVYHDLYHDQADTFAKTAVRCGINGWIQTWNDGRKHYVVYNPSIIKIIDRIYR